jgi:hypothetical protein
MTNILGAYDLEAMQIAISSFRFIGRISLWG